ncbi:MAG: PKD domain-containing protein, partial [Thermoplasmata archaeon]
GTLRRVDYRIDGGTWLQASGDSSWSIVWNTSKRDNGLHRIEVRAYDGMSYSDVQILNLSILNNNPPKANFTIKNKASIGENILFDARNSIDTDGDELTYTWIFGDGIQLNGISVKHAYSKPGRYNVTLIVNDSINTSSFSQQISVLEKASSSKVPGFSLYLSIISIAILTLAARTYLEVSRSYITSAKDDNLPRKRKHK